MDTYNRHIFVFIILFTLVCLIYSNSLDNSWQYDDYHNIVENTEIHLSEFTLDSVTKLFSDFTKNGFMAGRPVAMFSFALNWLIGGADPTGYHFVNTMIHCLTAFVLFLSIGCLFNAPMVSDKYSKDQMFFLALLSAVLWAVHPIQTQAVTYIVQRMASLAAFFSISCIYFYLQARLKNDVKSLFLYGIVALVCYLGAIGSKENAVLLPFSIILIEIIFFQTVSNEQNKKKILFLAVFSVIFILCFYLLYVSDRGGLFFFLKGYEHRTFSFIERLMTSPYVLVFYLSQIFYPTLNRFSVKHDIEISSSLIAPWTTLPCFTIVFILVIVGFLCYRKKPFLSFAIFFYFINHIVESSIFPLEIIYEHRNYLPSLFIFVPVAQLVKYGIDHYDNKKFVVGIFCVLTVSVIWVLGMTTYTRNYAWRTPYTLWKDVMVKYPELAIPYYQIARILHEEKSYNNAINLYAKSLTGKKQSKDEYVPNSYLQIGNIFFETESFPQALDYYQKAISAAPEYLLAYDNSIAALINVGKWDSALKYSEKRLAIEKDTFSLNAKAFILCKLEQYDHALTYLSQALKLSPESKYTRLYIGTALSNLGFYGRADWYLNMAYRTDPSDIMVLLSLIENAHKLTDKKVMDTYVAILFSKFSVMEIVNTLSGRPIKQNSTLVSLEFLKIVLANEYQNRF